MTATLIDRLPHKDDPRRITEERLAQDVAVVSYLGEWWCKYGLTLHGRSTDYIITLLLATADTVSERNKNIVYTVINCFIRQTQLCKRYSWQWHYIRKSRRKLRQKSTLW